MVCTESAKLVTALEIKEMIEDENIGNPTISGLLFIETKGKGDVEGRLFPCYIHSWAEEDVEGLKMLMFQADIIQYAKGEFCMVRVILHEKDFGITKRIWDKPPTKGLREEIPFLESEIQ